MSSNCKVAEQYVNLMSPAEHTLLAVVLHVSFYYLVLA